jgi:anti-anti-sigma factor
MKPRVEKYVNANAVMIILSGQLDVTDSRELMRLVNVEKLERDVVVFDLSKATYMSSSVLGQLVSIRSQLNTTAREPIIVGCNKQIFDLFEMTGVVHLFKFVNDK